jgi:hypothetical protein
MVIKHNSIIDNCEELLLQAESKGKFKIEFVLLLKKSLKFEFYTSR